jgi:hypothetical protein
MDLDHQLADGGERATVDDLAFDDPEPDLDEVEAAGGVTDRPPR